jgi:carbon-monoxide dehydrogenase large subunit
MSNLRPKNVGASVKRVEDPRLLTGQGSYTDDLRPADLLHAAILRSPHAFARLGAIDTSAAKALPGVAGAFTAADFAGQIGPIQAPSKMRDYKMTTTPLLATDTVRYVGEPIAVVVAESRYVAEDALRLIDYDIEPLAAEHDPEAAAAPGAPPLHAEFPDNVILAREFKREDVDAALAGAAVTVGARFRFRRKAVMALESRCYLAEYHAGRRELTLHGSTQVPGIIRDCLSDLTGLPGNAIRVVAADVGGGFGGKASLYNEEVLVCLLARKLGKPVKWTSDRLEDLSSTSQSFDQIIDATLGLDAEGNILGLKADVTGDVGAYSIYPWTAALEPVQVVSFLPGPYHVPAYRGRVRGVATPKVPMGPYRGVGRPPACFAMERLIDMAARKLKLSPVELRRRNLVKTFPYRAASGLIWDQSAFVEALDAVDGLLDEAGLREWQAEARAAGRHVGIGFASYAELTGIGSKIPAAPGMPVTTGIESATVRIDPSGAVTAIFGIASHGQGLETTLAQVVADALGCRLEDIRVVQGDTAGRAYGTGTYASRSTVLAGGAGTLAAQAVRDKLLKVAADTLEAAVEDLEVADSRVAIRGTDRSVSFRDVARRAYLDFGRLPKALQGELEETRLYDPSVGTTSSATHACVVEVDVETCGVRVLRYIVAEDCGVVINPMIVDGQVHGGVAQGIGAALLEEVVYDDDGQLLTGSLVDYVVPSASEIPEIVVTHMESPSPTTLGGYRGMGEGGTIGAPAAVANAVSDALAPLGIEITELPITPERLFRLLHDT